MAICNPTAVPLGHRDPRAIGAAWRGGSDSELFRVNSRPGPGPAAPAPYLRPSCARRWHKQPVTDLARQGGNAPEPYAAPNITGHIRKRKIDSFWICYKLQAMRQK